MSASAIKLLQNQLKRIYSEPVEGFTVEVPDENNLTEWKIYLEGPKETPYEGGVFQMVMNFPADYPMSPPTLRFVSEFWHPNVYPDGRVCISILHPPIADEMSGELPEERWLPTQTVPTVILSIMSLLSDPNFSSPANVDASVELRKDKEAFGKRVKRLVEKANREVPSRIKIPHPDTDPEERKKTLDRMRMSSSQDIPYEDPFAEDMDLEDMDQDGIDEELEEEPDEGSEEMEKEEDEEPVKPKQKLESKKEPEKKLDTNSSPAKAESKIKAQ